MTGGSPIAQFLPDMTDGLERLVGICSPDGDNLRILQTSKAGYDGQAELLRGLVDKDEKAVVPALGDGLAQRLFQMIRDDYLLWGHIIYGCLVNVCKDTIKK